MFENGFDGVCLHACYLCNLDKGGLTLIRSTAASSFRSNRAVLSCRAITATCLWDVHSTRAARPTAYHPAGRLGRKDAASV